MLTHNRDGEMVVFCDSALAELVISRSIDPSAQNFIDINHGVSMKAAAVPRSNNCTRIDKPAAS